jgi:hypothetical protein
MSMSEYEERFSLSGTKIGRWFQTNSDFFSERSRRAMLSRPSVTQQSRSLSRARRANS